MRHLRGRNPYQFALGAIAAVGGALIVLNVVVQMVAPPSDSGYAYVAGGYASGASTLVALFGFMAVLATIAWLVVGALLWGPRRTPDTDTTAD